MLWNRFDAGEIAPSVVGDDEFFIRDYTWGTHDLGLVLRELSQWAEERGQVQEASAEIMNAISQLVSQGEAARAYQVVRSFVVMARYRTTALELPHETCVTLLGEADASGPVGSDWWDSAEYRRDVRAEFDVHAGARGKADD
jgi:hypothetical protein